MFQVKNARTGKMVKDMISGKPFTFSSKEDAQNAADAHARASVLNATAWNSVRKSNYIVVPA